MGQAIRKCDHSTVYDRGDGRKRCSECYALVPENLPEIGAFQSYKYEVRPGVFIEKQELVVGRQVHLAGGLPTVLPMVRREEHPDALVDVNFAVRHHGSFGRIDQW